jgi:hypothetical protein
MISDEFAHTILHRHGQPAAPPAARHAVAPVVKKVEAKPSAVAIRAPVKRKDPAAIYGAPVRPQQRVVKPAMAAAKRPAGGSGPKVAALRLKQKREQEKKEQIAAIQRKRKEAEERDKKRKDALRAEVRQDIKYSWVMCLPACLFLAGCLPVCLAGWLTGCQPLLDF